MEIRTVTADDAADVARLLDQLGYQAPETMVRDKLARIAEGDTAFVAVVDGCILGFISLHAHELIHRPGRLGRITALVVDSDSRGSGIGKALSAHAEDVLGQAGCTRVEVTSGEQRSDAHAFYQALGYDPTGRRFAKAL